MTRVLSHGHTGRSQEDILNTTTDTQISHLRAGLNGKVIGADDPRYDDARRVVFTGFDRRPAAIVRAADASDVARVVTLARETGAELAVRSGGHSRAGHGTSEGGIVLDLSAMNAVEIDADGRTRVGADRGHGRRLHHGDRRTRPRDRARRHGERRPRRDHPGRRHRLPRPQERAHDRRPARGRGGDRRRRASRGGRGEARRSLLGAPGRRRQLRCRDQTAAPAPRDRPGRRRDAAAPREHRRDHRAGRRGGRGPGGALHDREHPEGAAAAVHPRGAARQARGDRPDGLRGRRRGR